MMFRLRRCSIRTGALLILALLSGGCAGTGVVSDHTERRGVGDTGRHHSSSDRHRQSVEVELDGEYGFTLTEVVRIDGDVRRDYQEGVALLQAGQLEAGIELLERVVEAAPDVTNPHIDLGVAYSRLGRYEASEASLRSALALAPNHPAALNELGILLRRTGRFEAARASYEQALIIHPGFHFALLNLGMLCDLYLQDLTCALDSYSRYEAVAPDDPDVAIWIADVKSRLTSETGE